MTPTILISFAIMASLLVISPGPNGLLIAKIVPTSGRNAGLAAVMGFMASFYLQGAFVVFGIAVILVQSATAFTIVKLLGAAYLIYIGVKALLQAMRGEFKVTTAAPAKRTRTIVAAFGEGFLTNILNPKTSMFYLAAVPQFLPLGEVTAANVFLLVFIHSSINGVWFLGMVMLLSKLVGVTQSATAQRWIKGITGTIFIGFGAKLATLRA